MGRTACTEPQCLYKGDLYLYLYHDDKFHEKPSVGSRVVACGQTDRLDATKLVVASRKRAIAIKATICVDSV